jgi:hypothetical protein
LDDRVDADEVAVRVDLEAADGGVVVRDRRSAEAMPSVPVVQNPGQALLSAPVNVSV